MKYYNEDGKEISGEENAVIKLEESNKVVKAFKKEGVHWENKWTAKNVELSDVHITQKVKVNKKEIERKLRILRGLYQKAEIQQKEIQKEYREHPDTRENVVKEYEKIDTVKEGLEKTFFILTQKLQRIDPENPELQKGIHNMSYIGFGGE